MSTILNYFASDESDDEFLYCIKCFESGSAKKFTKDNEGLLLGHLLEFHETLVSNVLSVESPTECIPDQIIQFSLSELEENLEPDEDVTPRNRQSAVWNYFEENDNRMDCLLCQATGIVHYYSTNSSTSNLRKHLLTAHNVLVENIRSQKKKLPKVKKKSSISRVWRYFSQIIIDSNGAQVSQEDFVYCRKCLELRVQHKYRRTTSTGTMKSHLLSVHGIEVNEDPENDEPMEVLTEDAVSSLLGEAEIPSVQKKSVRQSVARSYFQNIDRDYLSCMICSEEGREQRYSTKTSTTALKTHLMQIHMIDTSKQDPGTQEAIFEIREIRETRLESTFNLSDEEIRNGVVQKAQKFTKIRSRKIRTYFMSLEEIDMVYCVFCVAERLRKGYNTRTSTSVLRKHLQTNHQFDPFKLFEENMTAPIDDEELFKDSIQNSYKNRGDTWKYFSQKPGDTAHVYCNICWNAPIREIQKYSISTSSGGLRRHLRSRHRIFVSSKPSKLEEVVETENVKEEVLEEPPEIIEIIEEPVEKYCRSCGHNDVEYFTKLSAPFDDPDENSLADIDLTLAEIYAEVTGVIVTESDQMSQLICYMCEASLKHSYKFKKMALDTEHLMLQKLQESKNQIKDVEEEEEVAESYEFLEVEADEFEEIGAPKKLIQKKRKRKFFTVEESSNDIKENKTESTEAHEINEGNDEFDLHAEEYDVPIAIYDMRSALDEEEDTKVFQEDKKLRLS